MGFGDSQRCPRGSRGRHRHWGRKEAVGRAPLAGVPQNLGGRWQRQYNCKSYLKMDFDVQKTKSHSNQSTEFLKEQECLRSVPREQQIATLVVLGGHPQAATGQPGCLFPAPLSPVPSQWSQTQVRHELVPTGQVGTEAGVLRWEEAPWGAGVGVQDLQVSLGRARPSYHTRGGVATGRPCGAGRGGRGQHEGTRQQGAQQTWAVSSQDSGWTEWEESTPRLLEGGPVDGTTSPLKPPVHPSTSTAEKNADGQQGRGGGNQEGLTTGHLLQPG